MLKYLFISIFTLSFLAAIAHPKDSVGIEEKAGKKFIQYKVESGQTLYSISREWNVPVAAIQEANDGLAGGLKSDKVILIPYHPALNRNTIAKTDNAIYHTVQDGETYYSISRRYDVPVSELMERNGLELKAGQKIIVGFKNPNAIEGPKNSKEPLKEQQPNIEDLQHTSGNPKKVIEPITDIDGDTEREVVVPYADAKKQEKEDQQKAKKDTALASTTRGSENFAYDPSKKFGDMLPNDGVDYNNNPPVVMVVPFNPYFYFSDADAEIAKGSNIHMNDVRYKFRNRLNSLIEPNGFETHYLLGRNQKDSLTELNKIFSSVDYSYQDILYKEGWEEENRMEPTKEELKTSQKLKGKLKNTVKKTQQPKQEENVSTQHKMAATNSRSHLAKDDSKYYGVLVKDTALFSYFNSIYKVDYYVFINQFEIKTHYDHCLDRTRGDYERTFTVHFSIFDAHGKLVAGNKYKMKYNSGTNDIQQIMLDNLQPMTDFIESQLPDNK